MSFSNIFSMTIKCCDLDLLDESFVYVSIKPQSIEEPADRYCEATLAQYYGRVPTPVTIRSQAWECSLGDI